MNQDVRIHNYKKNPAMENKDLNVYSSKMVDNQSS